MKDIDPIMLARQGAELIGQVALSKMDRLRDICPEVGAEASYRLQFHDDGFGKRYIDGSIQVSVALMCQRCNQPVIVDLDISTCLQVVKTDQEGAHVEKDREPFLVTQKSVSLVALVEEEILLGLPIVAKHQQGSCPVELPDYLH